MLNDFPWEDDEKFQKKLKLHIVLCFVLFLLLAGMQLMRSDSTKALSDKYNDIKAKEQWLQKYQPVLQEGILQNIKRPSTQEQLEAARQAKTNLFQKNQLKIDSIMNGETTNATAIKGLKTVESTADLEGTWSSLCNCLAAFTEENVSAITGVTIDGKDGGNLKTRLTYKIYYR